LEKSIGEESRRAKEKRLGVEPRRRAYEKPRGKSLGEEPSRSLREA
jgi:hypothetical protein